MNPIKLFGTDGIRGTVGQGIMNPEQLAKLGWAIGQLLKARFENPTVVIGKDTRVSGYLIESALESGLAFSGADIYLVGPMPTPGLSFLTQDLGASMGLMISASHNPYQDNGIKFFNHLGNKLSDADERQLTSLFQTPIQPVAMDAIGKAKRITDAQTRYMLHCTNALPRGKPLAGLKVVLDCANGAAYQVGPMVFQDLGAEVVCLHNTPDGLNINAQCGSTAPESLIAAVRDHHADCGIALDGDADRIAMVCADGRLCDGDDVLYILTTYSNTLTKQQGVVGTHMTNMGLASTLRKQNIPFHRTAVGDRFVARELADRNWHIGGEPSGHIIYPEHSQTGDGILSGLLVMSIMQQQQAPLADLLAPFQKWPQAQCNITRPHDMTWSISKSLQQKIDHWDDHLQGAGRILIRPSGTEPCIRIMVEAQEADIAETILAELRQHITEELALHTHRTKGNA